MNDRLILVGRSGLMLSSKSLHEQEVFAAAAGFNGKLLPSNAISRPKWCRRGLYFGPARQAQNIARCSVSSAQYDSTPVEASEVFPFLNETTLCEDVLPPHAHRCTLFSRGAVASVASLNHGLSTSAMMMRAATWVAWLASGP